MILAWGKKVSPEFRRRVIEICKFLDCDPSYMMAAIAFETGEKFSPSVKNAAGSGATGLIQFMPATAHALGYTVEQLTVMTPEGQLDVVFKYFKRFKGKLKTLSDVYMAILWPAAVGKPDDHVLFRKNDPRKKYYAQNAGLDIDRDGDVEKQECAAKVTAKYKKGMKPEYSFDMSAPEIA